MSMRTNVNIPFPPPYRPWALLTLIPTNSSHSMPFTQHSALHASHFTLRTLHFSAFRATTLHPALPSLLYGATHLTLHALHSTPLPRKFSSHLSSSQTVITSSLNQRLPRGSIHALLGTKDCSAKRRLIRAHFLASMRAARRFLILLSFRSHIDYWEFFAFLPGHCEADCTGRVPATLLV